MSNESFSEIKSTGKEILGKTWWSSDSIPGMDSDYSNIDLHNLD